MAKKIIFIGSGNVATHLSIGLKAAGNTILQVFSRKISKAKRLAKKLNCQALNDMRLINKDADLYVIAVHDDGIAKVAELLTQQIGNNKTVVHTSGSIPSQVLKPYFKIYGIFYPLQTMSVSEPVNLKEVPFCIFSNRKTKEQQLIKLAKTLSPKVYSIDDEQRAKLHVAAVLVNNFSNHLFYLAKDILTSEKLEFDILKPLINETTRKIQREDPYAMQTGPARRGDEKVIQKHLNFLEKHPAIQEIYRIISDNITKTYQSK